MFLVDSSPASSVSAVETATLSEADFLTEVALLLLSPIFDSAFVAASDVVNSFFSTSLLPTPIPPKLSNPFVDIIILGFFFFSFSSVATTASPPSPTFLSSFSFFRFVPFLAGSEEEDGIRRIKLGLLVFVALLPEESTFIFLLSVLSVPNDEYSPPRATDEAIFSLVSVATSAEDDFSCSNFSIDDDIVAASSVLSTDAVASPFSVLPLLLLSLLRFFFFFFFFFLPPLSLLFFSTFSSSFFSLLATTSSFFSTSSVVSNCSTWSLTTVAAPSFFPSVAAVAFSSSSSSSSASSSSSPSSVVALALISSLFKYSLYSNISFFKIRSSSSILAISSSIASRSSFASSSNFSIALSTFSLYNFSISRVCSFVLVAIVSIKC
mmetsp:Transcript_33927/g.49676  ORF Transcript_33927/g.49676 Transcript_33927/m.49676 type:complete len:380 (+) Transcript_33927:4382-5521(+)